jgi:hypothetical protein
MAERKPSRKDSGEVKSSEAQLILVDQIEPLIHTVRNQKVMLDSDLALLYGIATKRLNEQVRAIESGFPRTSYSD